MPTSSSTSSESPRIGLPNAPPPTVGISTSIAASMAMPPSTASRSARRVIRLLTAVLCGGGEKIVQHLLSREAALVHLVDPDLVHRLYRLHPARLLLVGQREDVVAGFARLLLRAFGEAVPHLADVLCVFQDRVVVDPLAQLGG